MKPFLIILISLLATLNAFGQDALHNTIKKIEYQSWPGDWEDCSFKIIIDANCTVEYKGDSIYCKPIIGKHQRINKNNFDSLIGMLDKIKFQELKDRYGYGVDCGGSVLTIIYNNGKAKKVTVICGDEPKGLGDILHLLYGLKDTEQWK